MIMKKGLLVFAVLVILSACSSEPKNGVYSYEIVKKLMIINLYNNIEDIIEEESTGKYLKAIYSNDTVYVQYVDFPIGLDYKKNFTVKYKDGKLEFFDANVIRSHNDVLRFHEYWSSFHLNKFYTIDDVQYVHFVSYKNLSNDTIKIFYAPLDPHKLFSK